jgi:hypothetical protein
VRPGRLLADNGGVETAEPLGARPREIVILGSTGSIGTQALDIIRRNPDRFRVVALAAGGSDPEFGRRTAGTGRTPPPF